MFAAAMMYSTPKLEMSIYSTCKRISQKLLRNVYTFLEMIHAELGTPKMKEIRHNFEEIVLQGTESEQDVRIVNSYPSKVTYAPTLLSCPRKCSAVIVSTLHILATRAAEKNRCSSMCSLASCRATMAFGSQSRSDLKSCAYSLARREKTARGNPRFFLRR
jgi:hypothetical protein